MSGDQYFLHKAKEVGNKRAKPYNFGAVVVKDGEIIAADHGHVQATKNPSLHAEISTIIEACKTLGSNNIDGCILYASHEPCLMCLACAAWAHIERVVYAIPASEQSDFMYEFKDFSAQDFAKKLPRPMEVALIRIKDEQEGL